MKKFVVIDSGDAFFPFQVNQEGTYQVLAKFHDRKYAEGFAKKLTKQAEAEANADQPCNHKVKLLRGPDGFPTGNIMVPK